jgi:hypothetical protein
LSFVVQLKAQLELLPKRERDRERERGNRDGGGGAQTSKRRERVLHSP